MYAAAPAPLPTNRRKGQSLIVAICAAGMLAACGQTEAKGPDVDHAKLSRELETRAAEIEARADASVAAVERDLAGEIAEMREPLATPAAAE